MINNNNLKKESIRGFIWRVFQNVSTQLMSLLISIVLARMLLPSDYGIIGLTSVFISILNVFVSTGFTSALVQKKEVTETDKSSMFFLSIIVGAILYIIIFLTAPFIASFYNMSILTSVLRIQGISLVVASLFSVHYAIIMRNLAFKKSFVAGLVAIVCQGIVGITMAFKNFGVWSLVFGTLTNNIVNCIMLFILCGWSPKPKFSFLSIKKMFSFSSKVLAANLLNTVYNSTRTLVIGRVYDADAVGYYNKGNQFPLVLMTGIDGAMSTVLFSSLSKIQDNKRLFIHYLRRSLKVSLAVVTPMLCGMAAVADPMIRLLLTDKWIEAVPFVMLTCAICITWPLSARLHALNAIGKSGISLAITISMEVLGVILLFASVPFGIYAMCASSLLLSVADFTIISIIISKNFDYSVREQLLDILPIYLIGLIMFVSVYWLSIILNINVALKLFILIIAGVLIYYCLSSLFRLDGFLYLKNIVKKRFKKNITY